MQPSAGGPTNLFGQPTTNQPAPTGGLFGQPPPSGG